MEAEKSTRLAWAWLIAAVAVAIRISHTPAAEAAEPRPAGRAARITLMALGDNRVPDIENLAHRYDLMIASASVEQEVIAAFRARNPGARVFCYVNTSDANGDLANYPWGRRLWEETTVHEDWFHHDAQGQRVRIYFPRYSDRCAFDTGNPELQQYLAGEVVEVLRTGLYDGIQLDNVSTEFPFPERLVGQWISAVPIDLTPAQWTADEVAMLRTIVEMAAAAGFADKTIIFNHMRSGEPEESRAYLEVVDGANCENWMSQRTGLEGRWGWKAKVEQVHQANRAGKLTNLLCESAEPTEEDGLFCFASYLMALQGDQGYFFYGSAYRARNAVWYPFYDADLGVPRGDGEFRDGGFWRPFTRGGVAVNPTSAPVTIALPALYTTLDGRQVREIALAPKEAAILLARHGSSY